MKKLPSDHALTVIAQHYGRAIKQARTKESVILTPEQKENFMPRSGDWRKVLHWLGDQNLNKFEPGKILL